MRADYLYRDYPRNSAVLFEVRSQLTRGSTDEKLVYAVELLGRCPYAECCLVLFADGFRKRTITAAMHRASELTNDNKRIIVVCAISDVLYRYIKQLVDHGTLRQ